MGRIRVLSDEIANKIAAGEVVERPASVAKELLENALDAGATEIRVEAEAGGARLLKVTDNGCGMGRDDAMLAFERHATSKLRSAEDLAAIATLGFRGEALPSIAAVSRLSLRTREMQAEVGTLVEIHGGRMRTCEDTAAPAGTSVTVADLFYNVPARKKFLRSEQTELAHLGTLLTHYSLAHPEKSFELRHGSRVLLDVSPVMSLEERLYQVFGGQTLEDLIDLGETARELMVTPPAPPPWKRTEEVPRPVAKHYRLRGFVSGPHVQKPNRNAIYLFVNGRLIRDKLVLHALTRAYHNLIPPDTFPFAALFLECPADEVDVNVHPSKTEIRFHHRNFVHNLVEETVRDRLMALRPAAPAPAPEVMGTPAEKRTPGEPGGAAFSTPSTLGSTSAWTYGTGNAARSAAGTPRAAESQPASRLPYSEFTQRQLDALYASAVDLSPNVPSPSPAGAAAPLDRRETGARPDASPLPGSESDAVTAAYTALRSEDSPNLEALRRLRPIGQWKHSFIVAVGEDGVWLIDQHIAHERILFEKILDGFATGKVESQRLLMPVVMEISAGAQLDYAAIEAELRAMGFETEPFGVRTIAIKAAPADLPQGEIEAMIREVLEDRDRDWRTHSPEAVRRELAASMACKAAIKINMPLEQTKMEWLLRTLADTRYPMTCPHGRPIALRYGANDILKAFQRI